MDRKKVKSKKKKRTSTAGFEPARAKPNRFQVCLLNHSDISTCLKCLGSDLKYFISLFLK